MSENLDPQSLSLTTFAPTAFFDHLRPPAFFMITATSARAVLGALLLHAYYRPTSFEVNFIHQSFHQVTAFSVYCGSFSIHCSIRLRKTSPLFR